ncbi:Glycosyl transferase, group 2 family protein [plant metagenome]|uniref:Glycosyl transferase, group 2 family protein n=1 Tax=plant metagenome TaxID=1297885 RepID=A0A484SN36_9ZZZZ
MIGVVIPAHNEAALISVCLASVQVACAHPGLAGEPVEVVVVLDDCSDGTALIAAAYPVTLLDASARNVGMARAQGARHLIEKGARWLAFTDADTSVSPDWLPAQLACQADAVCGTVGVADWSVFQGDAALLHAHFNATYQDADNHRHVHGANFGISVLAYLRAGGFPALACSEDQALVDTLVALGVHIAWSAAPRVLTSARQDPRAAGGFGDALRAALLRCREQAGAAPPLAGSNPAA